MSGRSREGEQVLESGPDIRLEELPILVPGGLARLRSGGRVAVVGLGTVGGRVASGLATLGMSLLLIDHGRVEPVNIGLQPYGRDDVGFSKCAALARRLRTIRPELPLSLHETDVRRLGPRLLNGCRLVISCLDSFAARIRLAQTAAYLAIPYLDLALDGTGHSLYGRAGGFDPARGTACMTCGWDEHNWAEVGGESPASGCVALAASAPEAPATLALPGLAEAVAGLGIIQAVRLLLGRETGHVLGREWRLNLSAALLTEVALSRDPRCRLDHQPWPIEQLDCGPSSITVGELFDQASECLGGEAGLEVYDEPLVLEARCTRCQSSQTTLHLRDSLPPCPDCGGPLVPMSVSLRARFHREEVGQGLDRTWAELGVVPGGAVRAVREGQEERVFLFEA